MTIEEERDKAYPPIGTEVIEPRVYHRNDVRFLQGVFHPKTTNMGFFGLRRFGKSSFLRQVQNACAPGGLGEGYEAHFISMQATPERLNSELAPILSALEDESRRFVILLDDLQQVHIPDDKSPRARSATKKLAKTIGDIYGDARASGGRIKVVICEPTNMEDWLAGRVGAATGFGPLLAESVESFDLSQFSMLPKLNTDQAGHILYGVPRGGRFPQGYDAEFVAELNEAMGGNPWFLAIAAQVLEASPLLFGLDRIASIVSAVDERSNIENAKGRLSIYEALSQAEQVMVKILSARRSGNRQAQEMFRRNPWTQPAGQVVSTRLCQLGIATDAGMDRNCASDLGSETFAQTVATILGDRSIVSSPIRNDIIDEVEIWREICKSPHPMKSKFRPSIIHQFSDLFFDKDGRSKSWDAYIEWLRAERTRDREAKEADKVVVSKRPHFIVLCGNLGYGASKDPEHALDEIARAAKLMQGLDDDGPPKPSQVIIVPGVFDLEWGRWESGANAYRATWDSEVLHRGFTPAGRAVNFPEVGLEFFAFDTVDTDDLGQLDLELQDDVVEVRKLVTQDFRQTWENVVIPGPGRADRVHLEKLWRYTLEYIAPLEPGQKRPSSIKSENLIWRERINTQRAGVAAPKVKRPRGGGKPETVAAAPAEYRVLLTEQGYVSKEAREALLKSVSQPGAGISIAVMHHYLKPRRRSAVTEFFQPFDFHKGLMGRGVQLVLHGHSAGPQYVMEQVQEARRGDGEARKAMHFLGSGSYSAHGMWVVDSDEEDPRCEPPTFNEIRIRRKEYVYEGDHRGDSDARSAWSVDVSFFEVGKEGPGARESPKVDFLVYDND